MSAQMASVAQVTLLINKVLRTHEELNRSAAALMTYAQEDPQICAINELRHLRGKVNEALPRIVQCPQIPIGEKELLS
jgi:hypothetical protein